MSTWTPEGRSTSRAGSLSHACSAESDVVGADASWSFSPSTNAFA
jgi:hypothetical protein